MRHGGDGVGSTEAAPGRDESPEERADRQWSELLQELRVVQTGVQILFGFLLTVAFQQRFPALSGGDRTLYTVTMVLGAAATGALVGPASLHRMLAGHRLKPETVVWASRLTVLGLVLLVCTMAAALLLVLRVAGAGTAATWIVTGMVVWFALAWFLLPLLARHRARERRVRR
ncbi:DUF6328 family protein [Streptomyces sp. NPDC005840]|uniref:DUF6328 family protein n=1 Tax=Streptomyces sp. NPDC005840 TaxID=3157072 RepID=UPI0033C4ECE2